MHETPFTLLVRRDRQKKIMAKTNIVEMTEKIKAINCIAKNAETTNSPASNSSAKEKYAILLCNSVRKSRLFRKILNRSTEHRLTTQECEQFRRKFQSSRKGDKQQTRSVIQEICLQQTRGETAGKILKCDMTISMGSSQLVNDAQKQSQQNSQRSKSLLHSSECKTSRTSRPDKPEDIEPPRTHRHQFSELKVQGRCKIIEEKGKDDGDCLPSSKRRRFLKRPAQDQEDAKGTYFPKSIKVSSKDSTILMRLKDSESQGKQSKAQIREPLQKRAPGTISGNRIRFLDKFKMSMNVANGEQGECEICVCKNNNNVIPLNPQISSCDYYKWSYAQAVANIHKSFMLSGRSRLGDSGDWGKISLGFQKSQQIDRAHLVKDSVGRRKHRLVSSVEANNEIQGWHIANEEQFFIGNSFS